ncbi:MAG TPA: imidazole glycerol phosphate synthase subunit HisH [Thermodesulfovibrionales bacterium]|nr:imidazole glycerol phosphate synthase subunit HisH [Thermodesulfovibrionales bacterium]
MIAIVDYGMGNLRSVEKGFLKVGVDARVVSDPSSIDQSAGIVLPGVGAFRDCIRNLTDANLTDSIIRGIRRGKPFLGICLGLQVLFSESEEFGVCKGLDLFRGKVVRFTRSGLKVPHMGWNSLTIVKRPPIFDGIPDNAYFYFVHSFYVVPQDREIVATTTDYGGEFTSMIWKDNVFATQFHPEKSQELGLKILKGFGEFVRKA